MKDSLAAWIVLVVALVFIFQGEPDIFDIAHAKVVKELSK